MPFPQKWKLSNYKKKTMPQPLVAKPFPLRPFVKYIIRRNYYRYTPLTQFDQVSSAAACCATHQPYSNIGQNQRCFRRPQLPRQWRDRWWFGIKYDSKAGLEFCAWLKCQIGVSRWLLVFHSTPIYIHTTQRSGWLWLAFDQTFKPPGFFRSPISFKCLEHRLGSFVELMSVLNRHV